MSSQPKSFKPVKSGPIDWMVHNKITPNLIMMFLILGGLFASMQIKQEIMPDFDLDMVTVSVPYPGASPEEVEQGIILSIEENVRGLDGIDEVYSMANEGAGIVRIELLEGVNRQKVYQEIKQEVDRITTFPEDAEEPEVTLNTIRREVLKVELFGDVNDWTLRNLAEELRDQLLQDSQITQVDLKGSRDYEIHVEISQENLRAYGLTLQSVADKLRATSLELPGGDLDTEAGEILVRFKERRDWATEFANIPIITTQKGAVLYLSDIATVRDGFEEADRYGTYNRKPSIGLAVYRIGDQTPQGVSEAVRRVMKEAEPDLPPGIHYAISNDESERFTQRMDLMLSNGFYGLILVLFSLGLFLDIRLAFWVTMGIPISFLGSFLFLPGMDISINMISMTAFIVALGIVVDDAIVAGENIYEYRQQGMNLIQASIEGAKDVSVPIAFSILTNVAAFLPMLFMPGIMGKFWKTIPIVVTSVFLISWFESIFILPSHLAHIKKNEAKGFLALLNRLQKRFQDLVWTFINFGYGPFLARCARWRYLTVSVSFAFFILVAGYVASGRIGLILMPRVEQNVSSVTAVLPYGSPLSKATVVRDQLIEAAYQVADENGGDQLMDGIFAIINENEVEIEFYLTDAEVRGISTSRVTQLWREQTGLIPGLESIQFASDKGGPGSGASLEIELSHRDIDVLDRASETLAAKLAEFPNVKDIDDGYTPGKQQFDFRLKNEGRSLGLTTQDVARQVRNAFYGAEAIRQQRGRNEVKVMVRLPKSQRISEYDIEQLLIRTPSGKDIPLLQAAEVKRGRSYTTIERQDGRRAVIVSADVDPIGDTNQVKALLNKKLLPELAQQFSGLTYSYGGRQEDMSDSLSALMKGFVLALLGIYFLLAVPFRSYTQPLIVMICIPFGIIGAVLGHILMGYNLSVVSMMGVVALSGVVVNDSLVLIDYANRLRREENRNAFDAIISAGIRRFRPILLTTLTTFGGLSPMILETSMQARFLIPMAISLGFGVLFATMITLIFVPCLYLVIEEIFLFLRPGAKASDM